MRKRWIVAGVLSLALLAECRLASLSGVLVTPPADTTIVGSP